jgi:hypothetical protein
MEKNSALQLEQLITAKLEILKRIETFESWRLDDLKNECLKYLRQEQDKHLEQVISDSIETCRKRLQDLRSTIIKEYQEIIENF